MDKHRSAKLSVAELDQFLRREFPQAFHDAGIIVEHVDGMSGRIRQRFNESMLRPGGTVSGPTLMTLADIAMYVALLSAIGPVGLAVTTNLTINFLRKPPAHRDIIAEARLLKLGRRLAVGEVLLMSDGGSDPVAHVTSTYSIPPTGKSDG